MREQPAERRSRRSLPISTRRRLDSNQALNQPEIDNPQPGSCPFRLDHEWSQACLPVQQAYILGQAFVSLVNTGDPTAFDQWLVQVAASGIVELQTFAAGLERDGDAVRAALRLPYSNGQVEGQVNRLKLINRMAAGPSLTCSVSVCWPHEANFTGSDGEPIIRRR